MASKHPYYKYNQIWTRDIQNTVCLPVTSLKIKAHFLQILNLVLCVWLGAGEKPQGSLLTIEEVSSVFDGMLFQAHEFTDLVGLSGGSVPSSIRDQDIFHITTEEYLHALISLIEELV